MLNQESPQSVIESVGEWWNLADYVTSVIAGFAGMPFRGPCSRSESSSVYPVLPDLLAGFFIFFRIIWLSLAGSLGEELGPNEAIGSGGESFDDDAGTEGLASP